MNYEKINKWRLISDVPDSTCGIFDETFMRVTEGGIVHFDSYSFSMSRVLMLLLASLFSANAFTAEPAPIVQDEIKHLLTYLEKSDCEFFRNGKWYGAIEAKDHLNRKYNYLLKKGMVRTTEDFVRLGASQSSMSGKPYRVRCKGVEPVPSASWLGEELSRDRQQARAKKQ